MLSDAPKSGREQPRLLFVSLFNDVASDRIVAAMGRLGARCAVMSTPDAFAAQTPHAERVFPLPRRGGSWRRMLSFHRRFAAAVRSWRPDLVIPLDELSAQVLRGAELYASAGREMRALLEASFGRPDTLACDRHRLVAKAAALAIATPTQVAVEHLGEARRVAASLGYPVVLKREQTCGGAGVQIVADEAALDAAFHRAAAKARAKRRVQRMLGRTPAAESPLVLQRFVEGPLAFRVVACKDGRVLDGVSFLSECVHPPVTGASTILQPISRPDMDAAAIALVGALGCSGFVALDFLLPAEGTAVLIEMNPRPVASGHLGALVGHDIYAAMLASLGAPIRAAEPVAQAPARIALFPRELDRDPSGGGARPAEAMLHDVPWDDAASLAAHAAWLGRRHPEAALRVSHLLGLAAPPVVARRFDRPRLAAALARFVELGRHASAK